MGTPVALITITVMLGMIMAIIDTTIVNVAIQTIGGNLGATVDEVAWVATGYILASVVIMPLNGWLTALLGRKRFYAISLALFTVASLLCGTARSIWVLVFYRIVQGIGGGALQPTAQAILFETFPPQRRGAAMAIFGMGAMVGPAIGPTLGGWIIDNANWPLIFYINVPIGIVAFVMTLAFIPNPRYISKPKGGIDWIGLGLLTAGLASLQFVLEQGERDDWFDSKTIVLLSVVAVVALVTFVLKALNDRHPIVDLSVFKFRSFSVGSFLGIIMGFGLFGTALILPLFFQTMLGFTAFDTGLALMPGAISTAISMLIIGRLLNRIDGRWSIVFGTLLFAWSTWLLGGLTTQAGYWDVFWPRLVQGFALGFLFVPLTTISLSDVPVPELANATGLFTLLRQLGGSLGIAILTTMLTHQTAVAWNELASGVTASHGYPVQMLTGMVAQQSAMIAYNYLFRVTAIVFVVSTPLIFLIRGHTARSATAAVAVAAE
ncbi:MAG TPA: DHA2 family efflux MFS transporter permease subunit [Candidatus Baltobacteraceae bacterium]|jgi:DHA2 family multidrug resistance protein|nr:DHA2 family efflux MFS transporter permease subunit [Candidatus Baltobacteraceae bacterium]